MEKFLRLAKSFAFVWEFILLVALLYASTPNLIEETITMLAVPAATEDILPFSLGFRHPLFLSFTSILFFFLVNTSTL